MNKLLFSILFVTLVATKTGAQDFVADSIKAAYSNATTGSARATALLGMAKYNWNVLYKDDTAIIIFNSVIALAKDKHLPAQEVEATMWLGKVYNNINYGKRDAAKGFQLTTKALALSRQYHLKAMEADLLLAISNLVPGKSDSAKLLAEQALNLALQNKLVEQQANALSRKADIYAASHPDSAKTYLLEAITIARQSQLPSTEINLLVKLAETYSLNHWGDSAQYLMQEAVRVARKNLLVDQEIRLLRYMNATEAGFFVKDSLVPYFDRMLLLSRQYKRDSLRFMENFAQSSTDIGDFPQALKTYFALLHAYELRKDSASIENALYGVALSYEATNDYKKTIEYLYKAEKYGQYNPFIYIFIHVDLAKSYLGLKQNDSARHYAEKAYTIATGFYGAPNNIYGGVLNDLGTVYNELGEDSLSIDYLRRSYVYFTTTSIQYLNYCSTTIGLAKYFKRKEMADSSIFYARRCLATARDKGFLPVISESCELMATYFQSRHHADSALYYQQIGFDAYKTMFNEESSRQFQNMSFSEQQREQDIAIAKKIAADQYASRLRLYALITVIAVALLIGLIVFRNNRQRQKSYDLLKKQKLEIDLQKSKLESSLNELQATQSQLIQSEKMASLGELTAGIAHEIQNPLNFVNNFSEVNTELIEELKGERRRGEGVRNIALEDELISNIEQNLEKIAHHGKRADAIVKGMLQHSGTGSGQKEPVDINKLADEYLRLAYHGLRAKDKSFNATLKTDFDKSTDKVNIIPQDIGRVILNLITNAFYAVAEKKKEGADKVSGDKYEPTVWVNTKKSGNKVLISVKDNGNGIPRKVLDKIFQPFFTTKPAGQGTGLGLSLAYDIVKAHGGELKVNTKENEGSEFIIQLPTTSL